MWKKEGLALEGGRSTLPGEKSVRREVRKRLFNHHLHREKARSESSMSPSFLVLFLSSQTHFPPSTGLASIQLLRQKNKGLLPNMNNGVQDGEENDGG